MAVTTGYVMSNADLENTADFVKTVILQALVRDGKLDKDEAEEWSKIHTLVRRRKGFFQTISDAWNKTEEGDNSFWSVVRKV